MEEDLTDSEVIGIIIVKEYADGSLVWETNYDPQYLIELLDDLIKEVDAQQYELPNLH